MALSENFETIKEFAATAAQTAVKVTRQVATIAKANAVILAEENKIKKAHLELGKLYYKDYVLDEEPDEAEYLPWCDKITESMKIIDEMHATIEAARAKCDEEEEEISIEIVEPEEATDEEPPAASAAPEEPEEDTEAPAESQEETPAEPADEAKADEA